MGIVTTLLVYKSGKWKGAYSCWTHPTTPWWGVSSEMDCIKYWWGDLRWRNFIPRQGHGPHRRPRSIRLKRQSEVSLFVARHSQQKQQQKRCQEARLAPHRNSRWIVAASSPQASIRWRLKDRWWPQHCREQIPESKKSTVTQELSLVAYTY